MPILLVFGTEYEARSHKGIGEPACVVTSAQGWSCDMDVRARRFDVAFVKHDLDPRYIPDVKELVARCVRPATEIESLRERVAALEAKLEGK